jgi:hypothetical protein
MAAAVAKMMTISQTIWSKSLALKSTENKPVCFKALLQEKAVQCGLFCFIYSLKLVP